MKWLQLNKRHIKPIYEAVTALQQAAEAVAGAGRQATAAWPSFFLRPRDLVNFFSRFVPVKTEKLQWPHWIFKKWVEMLPGRAGLE